MNTNNDNDSIYGVFSINGDIICEFVGYEAIVELSSKSSEQCDKFDSTSMSVCKSSTSDSQATKHQVKSVATTITKKQNKNEKFKSKSDSVLTLAKGALLRKTGGFASDLLDLSPFKDNSQSTMGVRSDVISSDQLTLVKEWRGNFIDKGPGPGLEINRSKLTTSSQYNRANEQESRIVRRDKSATAEGADQKSNRSKGDETMNECENGRESGTVESCSNVMASYDESVPTNDKEMWMPCHFHAPYASLCHHILCKMPQWHPHHRPRFCLSLCYHMFCLKFHCLNHHHDHSLCPQFSCAQHEFTYHHMPHFII